MSYIAATEFRKAQHHCTTEINKEAIFYFGNSIRLTTFIVSHHRLRLTVEGTRQSAMQVINWPELQPSAADLGALREHLQAALPLRNVCRLLVETTLRAYPWTGRADLISCYHPSQTYKPGQKVALFISHPQRDGAIVWLLGQVKDAKFVQNPIQGRFQVLTLELHGKQIQMAGGIANASYAEADLSNYMAEDLAWLVEWVLDTYAASLRGPLKKLIQKGQIRGQLAGETFLPEQVSTLSPELLHPIFARLSAARPWISLEEIFRELPDLSQLERGTILTLLRAALKESSYRSLGGNRWTTPELFHQFDREVPCGLPAVQIHSKMTGRTKRNEQDLAGYDSKFMPAEARRALEELGIGEKPSAPKPSLWHPPKDAVQLPALNYLHITQAYFPVCYVMRAFAPDVHMVFIQFIHGDHQPFLLDRENGLLKAIHPQKVQTKILEHDVPAGTHLWLEYQGNERYRIAPQPLPFKRRVTGKLAYLENNQLHIEHTQISMRYEGASSLFKTNLRLEEIEALQAEASRVNLSVRDAMIYTMQEICATDPDHRAHWLDLFNAVFLKRICSPSFVSFLLFTQPCFEPLGGGFFRHKPMPEVVRNTRKRKDRLSKLWDHLLSDRVPPRPVAEERTIVVAHSEVSYPISSSYAPNLEHLSLLSESETEPELFITSPSYTVVEEETARITVMEEEERVEPLPLSTYEPDPFTPNQPDTAEPVNISWKDDLERLLHSLVELEHTADSPVSAEEADSERETSPDMPIAVAHEESLSLSTPFRWEPRPAWVTTAVQPTPPAPNTVDTDRLVYRSKIPLRPLHKQRFYSRFLFYLRGWVSGLFRKNV